MAKKIFYTIYVLLLVVLGVYLFGGSYNSRSINKSTNSQFGDTLKVGFVFAPKSLNPFQINKDARNFLNPIYEGLTKTDRTLKVIPGLAVSWGLIDPLTYEFNLRKNVKFSNGNSFSADDVLYSYEMALNSDQSELKDLLSGIDNVNKISPFVIRIKLKKADPIFLSKLSLLNIVPNNYENFEEPVGIGAYNFLLWKGNELVISRNNDYWGEKPYFKTIYLREIKDSDDRIVKLLNGDFDLVADFPFYANCAIDVANKECINIDNPEIGVKTVPSLEVLFLGFNLKDPVLSSNLLRLAMAKAFNMNELVNLFYGNARSASQFVSNGVFGFNPEASKPDYNFNEAQKFLNQDSSAFEKQSFDLDFVASNLPMAQFIKTKLEDFTIGVNLNPLPANELVKSISSGKSQMFLFGWKSDFGDASDFLGSMVHSIVDGYGDFNAFNYSNEDVDKLILSAASEQTSSKRQKYLQEAMRIIVVDDVIGIPLIEPYSLFGYNKRIEFEPRVDGYLDLALITEKNNK